MHNLILFFLFKILPAIGRTLNQTQDKINNEINKAAKFLKKAGIDDDTIYKLRKKALLGNLIGKCKYCDPSWSYVNNFAESAKGYDVPSGNPVPGKHKYHLIR